MDLQDWSAVAEGDGIEAGEPVYVTGISGVRLHVYRPGIIRTKMPDPRGMRLIKRMQAPIR